MDTKKIGKFLRDLRQEQNLTQEELGEKLGATNKTISRWETGTYMPPADILLQLSKLYGVSVNEILCGERLATDDCHAKVEENIVTTLNSEIYNIQQCEPQATKGGTFPSNDTVNVYLDGQQELTQRKWSKLSVVGFSVSVVAFIIELIPWIYALTFRDLENAGEAAVPIFVVLILGFALLFGIVWLIGGLVGTASIIMSIVGLTNVVRQGKRGKAFAIIGIILSAISICPIALYLLSL